MNEINEMLIPIIGIWFGGLGVGIAIGMSVLSDKKRPKVDLLEEMYRNKDISKEVFLKYRKEFKDYEISMEIFEKIESDEK